MPITTPQAPAEPETAAIRQVVDAGASRILEGDWDHYLDLFTDDCVLMPPGAPIMKGKAAAKTWFKALPAVHAFASHTHEVAGSDRFAWACGTYTMTHPGEHGEHTDFGKWSCTFRHGEDGVWRIASDCWNADDGASFGDAPPYAHRDPIGTY